MAGSDCRHAQRAAIRSRRPAATRERPASAGGGEAGWFMVIVVGLKINQRCGEALSRRLYDGQDGAVPLAARKCELLGRLQQDILCADHAGWNIASRGDAVVSFFFFSPNGRCPESNLWGACGSPSLSAFIQVATGTGPLNYALMPTCQHPHTQSTPTHSTISGEVSRPQECF